MRPAYWSPDTARGQASTKGTELVVDFLASELALAPGMRVLDVGCGPGRHALSLARRSIAVHGVDRSAAFLELARNAAADERLLATFEQLDVRELEIEGEFDAAICLC